MMEPLTDSLCLEELVAGCGGGTGGGGGTAGGATGGGGADEGGSGGAGHPGGEQHHVGPTSHQHHHQHHLPHHHHHLLPHHEHRLTEMTVRALHGGGLPPPPPHPGIGLHPLPPQPLQRVAAEVRPVPHLDLPSPKDSDHNVVTLGSSPIGSSSSASSSTTSSSSNSSSSMSTSQHHHQPHHQSHHHHQQQQPTSHQQQHPQHHQDSHKSPLLSPRADSDRNVSSISGGSNSNCIKREGKPVLSPAHPSPSLIPWHRWIPYISPAADQRPVLFKVRYAHYVHTECHIYMNH